MSNYTLEDAKETCRNVVVRHRRRRPEIILELALAAVLQRVGKGKLPNGWREHLEETVSEELEGGPRQ